MIKDLNYYQELLKVYKSKLKLAKTDYEKWDAKNQIIYIKKVIKEMSDN